MTYFKGHTKNYVLVKYKTEEELENTLKEVNVVDAEDEFVIA